MAHLDGPPIKHFSIDPRKGSLGLPPFFFSTYSFTTELSRGAYLLRLAAESPERLSHHAGPAVPPCWSSCPTVPAQQRAAAGVTQMYPTGLCSSGTRVRQRPNPQAPQWQWCSFQTPRCLGARRGVLKTPTCSANPAPHRSSSSTQLRAWSLELQEDFFKTYLQVQYIVTEIVLKQVEDGKKNEWL